MHFTEKRKIVSIISHLAFTVNLDYNWIVIFKTLLSKKIIEKQLLKILVKRKK